MEKKIPINTDLLIASTTFQEALVDKNGLPMSFGTITFYHDNDRTILKNVYYQSGSPGNYVYLALPNPLPLSEAGTVCDINGVDTLPFFYPYSELDQSVPDPYYIVIKNKQKTNQITRENFPYNLFSENAFEEVDVENYIINNVFWRNIGSQTLNSVLSTTLCPSQHNGFSMPDVMFIKNNTSAQEVVTFQKFPLTIAPILTGDITPEFYINHTCSVAGTSETKKVYQWPISLHVNTLASQEFTFTIQGENIGGNSPGQNVISIYILQFTGTGTVSPDPILIQEIALTDAWQKYTITSVFPATEGLTLGQGGDDALYLQLQMPLNMTCSINFTKPSIYLSPTAPSNNFQTYDQINTVINSPRTGDTRIGFNNFYYFGWLPMNNGVIGLSNTGNVAGYTRANSDTWQLFNLLWNLGKTYDSGSNFNPICQMYSNNGTTLTATNYGSTAYADFVSGSNLALALPKMLGQALIGTVPLEALLSPYIQTISNITQSSSIYTFTCTSTSNFYLGMPLSFKTTGAFPAGIDGASIYYVSEIASATTFKLATTFANAIVGTSNVGNASVTYTGTLTINTLTTGVVIGEQNHLLSINEMPSHNHPPLPPGTQFGTVTGAGGFSFPAGSAVELLNTTGNTGGSAVHNNVQQSIFSNVFIKL